MKLLILSTIALGLLTLPSCMGPIAQNQAILQDVANDLGITIPTTTTPTASATSGTHQSASAAKAQAFWGN